MNNSKDSLKEYYVNLQSLYNNAVNMLTAINQSLASTSSEITVSVADTDDAITKIRIPSFLYLENKIEQLSNNFNHLFEMPSSGQAWFSNENNMFKLKMVQSNIAPITPSIDSTNIIASIKDNNFLKDLVNPRTYLKLNVNNIPNNIEKVYMKKIVILDDNVYNELESIKDTLTSYQDYVAALSNLTKGVQYEEYENTLNMPIRRDKFDSEFKIIEIPTLDGGNPYVNTNSDEYYNHAETHLIYEVRLDTLIYHDHEDPSIEYQLKVGDYLTLIDNFTVFKIKNISKYKDSITNSIVTLEEISGHTALQDVTANNNMILKLYQHNYSDYNYVEVPLEENPYIIIFLCFIDSNIRSTFSNPIFLNLNDIYMYNSDGTLMKNPKDGTNITYMSYYNQYCTNIGDIIQGISNVIYPQFTNINNDALNILENSESLKQLVTNSINKENIEVSCINNHIFDDEASEKINTLNAEKNKYKVSITDMQANIDNIYNQLTNTDFNNDLSITQESLKTKLDQYYTERTHLNKEYINCVNLIAAAKAENNITNTSKYRIRGLFDDSIVSDYIKANVSSKCELIGIDVEYKYVTVSSNQSNVTQINNSIFTNWNKYKSIDKERILKFDENNLYTIEYDERPFSDNSVKWNQIDIPINQGEDVVIRIRYKYNIGQPFMNLYSPWSDNVTFSFPEKFTSKNEIIDIIAENDNDIINAKFLGTLINDGYQEHVNNKIIDNSQVYYHMPENIYSGFNTPENKLISLKDKLISMSNDIDKYKNTLNSSTNNNYKVYLEYDNNLIELHNSKENIINFNNSDVTLSELFTKKTMNIIIKNIGETSLNLYSIFSGNMSVPLLNTNVTYINNTVEHYQRVPILINGDNDINTSVYAQTLGQWIYFRENNPYTLKDVYYNSNSQLYSDTNIFLANISNTENQNNYQFKSSLKDYLKTAYQVLLPYKPKTTNYQSVDILFNAVRNKIMSGNYSTSGSIDISENGTYNIILDTTEINSNILQSINILNSDSFTKYDINQLDNKYVLKYEHIMTLDGKYLTSSMDIDEFITNNEISNITSSTELEGMFLYPEIPLNTYLQCNTNELNCQYYTVAVGNTISVPVICEYYLSNKITKNRTLSKTICFDLKPSIDKDLDHYIITINVNQAASDEIINEAISETVNTDYNTDSITE